MQKERRLWVDQPKAPPDDQDFVSYLQYERDQLEHRLAEIKKHYWDLQDENKKLRELLEKNQPAPLAPAAPKGKGALIAAEKKVCNPEQEIDHQKQRVPNSPPRPTQPPPSHGLARPNYRPLPTGNERSKTIALPLPTDRQERPAPIAGIDFFPEVESSPLFRKYSMGLSESKNDGKCILCRGVVGGRDILLTNGRVIHSSCKDACFEKINQVKSVAEATLFFNDYPVEVLRSKWLCIYYPDYPPDWESRKRTILERARYECERCGESETELHVHHLHALGQGGNNAIPNLKCLCRDCHEKIHGKFLSDGKKPRPIWMERRDAIMEAMANKEDVEFDYTDLEGERTHRKITPLRFENRHGWLHVKGFCKLRKAERTFNIRRMRNITTKGNDGKVRILYQTSID